jgi:hypothetical protein
MVKRERERERERGGGEREKGLKCEVCVCVRERGRQREKERERGEGNRHRYTQSETQAMFHFLSQMWSLTLLTPDAHASQGNPLEIPWCTKVSGTWVSQTMSIFEIFTFEARMRHPSSRHFGAPRDFQGVALRGMSVRRQERQVPLMRRKWDTFEN